MTNIEAVFQANKHRRIIVAAHHPLITYGEHGGIFTWKAHIFPLAELSDYLHIPLPVIGSIYPLYRKWFGHNQDTVHPLYAKMSRSIQRIMADHPGSVFVAGHEHALQYIVRDSSHFIVSGSGAKTEHVKKKGDAVIATAVRGFARLDILSDGSLGLKFYQADRSVSGGAVIFETVIF